MPVPIASADGVERPTKFGYWSTAEEVTAGLDLRAAQILVTGVASGLGLETARVLASRGATIWGAARSLARAEEGLRGLEGDIRPLACDLGSPSSVAAAIQLLCRQSALDGIIANAGIMALPHLQKIRGIEQQFMVNHVGHFNLVTGLLPRLSPTARVVVVSSEAHRAAPRQGIDFDNLDGSRGYQPWPAYGRAKLANLLFARALSRRLQPGQSANAVHPGVVDTNLARSMKGPLGLGWKLGAKLVFKTVAQGAATQCFVATSPGLEGVTGQYFAHCQPKRPSRLGRDDDLAETLYVETQRLVAEFE